MPFNYKSEIERYRRYYQNINEVVQKPKPQAYTTAIFSFLAVSLFGWYAIRPTLQTILFLQREIADNKVVSQQMDDKIGKLIEAQATYQQLQSELPILIEALPDSPDAVDVVLQLRNLGNSTSASISAVTINAVPLVAGASESTPSATSVSSPKPSRLSFLLNKKTQNVPMTVLGNGTYSNVQSFLNGIARMRRIVSIESITLTPDTESIKPLGLSGDISLRMVLKLTAHYLD